jgi:hypothetical protein
MIPDPNFNAPNNHYNVGILVRIVGQEAFFSNMFNKNYIEYVVEGISRAKIVQKLQTFEGKDTSVFEAKIEILNEIIGKASTSSIEPKSEKKLEEFLEIVKKLSTEICDV